MRPAVMVVCLAALGMGFFPARLTAQRKASTSIDGFNELPWGTTGRAIKDKYGTPVQTDTLGNGIIVLGYRDALLGLPTQTMYAVLPDRGLAKGQHSVKLDVEAGDCEDQYRRLRDHITFTYPLIAPDENADFPYDMDFCTAVTEGVGKWATQWIDRSTSSIVTVIVEEGSDEVKLIFESALFLEWHGVSLPPEDED